MTKPGLIYIDDGNSATNTYQKFINNSSFDDVDIFQPGYYKYYKRIDNSKGNDIAIRCGHYPDFTNPEEI